MSNDNSVRVSRLSNGLVVASHALPHLETVALGLWVQAGSRDETADESGIAHFLEHMAFKGTKRRSAQLIVGAIEARGGDLNAATSPEHTGYTAHMLKDDWHMALDVIADIVCEPLFDPHEMERERNVILQEIAAANDDPVDVVFEQADRQAFGDHPLGRPVLGRPEVILRLQPQDLAAFREKHYGARRMVLAAAGNIDHDALLRQAENLLSHLPPGEPPQREKPIFRSGETLATRAQDQAHIVLAWPFPGYLDDAVWAAQVASSVLGGGMSSRLFQELREQRGLCYDTYSYLASQADGGVIYLYAATAPRQAEEARALLLGVARGLAREVQETELSCARAQARAALVMNLESAPARAAQLARQVFAWGQPRALDDIMERIEAVSAEDVMALARATFEMEPVCSVVAPGEPETAHGATQQPVTLH